MTRRMSLIVAAVLIVLVLGIGLYLFTRSPKPNPQQPVTSEQASAAPTETPAQETKGTFKDLLAQRKDVSCTIAYTDIQGNGTIYVSSPKFRGDISMQISNQPLTSHIISDGTYMYMWTDNSTKGTKIKMDLNQTPPPATSSSSQNQMSDLNKEVNFKCTPWTVDSSKFALPTDVQFSDFSNIKVPAQKGSNVPAVDKSVCNNIADPNAKAACLKALGG